jgi:hypothetical protein
MITERMYTPREACQITGCSYRALDYRVRLSVLGDDHDAVGVGSGQHRRFDARDIEILAACQKFADAANTIPAVALSAVRARLRPLPTLDGWLILNYGQRTLSHITDVAELANIEAAVIVALQSCRIEVLDPTGTPTI